MNRARWKRRSGKGISDGRRRDPFALPTLRFLTCGSVDDGKSTLIGRLLYKQNSIFDDQLSALARDSKKHGTVGDDIDFALLVDGLEAEREQGITIDVAYRYFSTARRGFVVATRPATSSSLATWRPALPMPTSPSCWSMPARACCRRPAAMPSSCRCIAWNVL